MMSAPQRIKAVVIGASAGGIDALSVILPLLSPEVQFAIVIVVHIPPDRNSMLVELFRGKCRLTVKEAEDKEPIEFGTVYFAPPDYHVLIEADHRLSLSSDERVQYSRPSIDVLFETAADAYEQNLLGIVLSGANSDGARGLRLVKDLGGQAIVQNPATAHSQEMPRSALAACPEAECLNLEEIGRYLQQISSAEEVAG
jgi:two-component system chemotaxis response regulator CheB